MAKDRLRRFVEKWFKRGCNDDDPFDQFFSLWIALIVAAQNHRNLYGFIPANDEDKDSEKRRVIDYLKTNRTAFSDALEVETCRMVRLAKRQGTDRGDPIVDVKRSRRLRELLGELRSHYLENGEMTEEQRVTAVAELLDHVRNNLFHGAKVYDDERDVEILQLLNPVLTEIIRRCERF